MATSGQFQKQSASTPARTYLTTNLAQRRPATRPKPTPQPAPEPDVQAKDDRTNSGPRFPNLIWNPTRYGVQPKLTVGAPNDQYEQEADRVADQVMSMPDKPVQRMDNLEEEELQTKPLAGSITPLVQRMDNLEEEDIQTKTSGNADIQREETLEEEEIQTKPLGNIQREDNLEEEELQTKAIDGSVQREEMPEEEEDLQMKFSGSIQREDNLEEEEIQTKPALQRSPNGSLEAGGSIETQLNSSKGGGSPLSDEVRSFMEPHFGADFSQVRVHTGSEAVQMNRDLNAQAFTHKQDVYFGAGKTPGKDALTAHELTHVVQQAGRIQTQVKARIQRQSAEEGQGAGGDKSANKILPTPPLIAQSGLTCWAAALLMWLGAKGGGIGLSMVATPEGIVDIYRKKGYTDQNGSLYPQYWKTVVRDYGMETMGVLGKQLTYSYINNLLSTYGYLLVMEAASKDWVHAYVIYGVESGESPSWYRADPDGGYTIIETLDGIPSGNLFLVSFSS